MIPQDPSDVRPDVGEAAALLSNRMEGRPELLLVLGSGLNSLAQEVEEAVEVPFSELPGFPRARTAGHPGRYVIGSLEGRRVLVQAGRYHLYEGHPPEVVVAPMRVAAQLGCRIALLTNAAGGIHRGLFPGAVLVVEDHLNLQWQSPLVGTAIPGEARFPDMSAPYDPALMRLATRTGAELRLPIQHGTYAGVLGPAYETPAEIRALASAGASAVGMSTVTEVLTARARGMRVLALSLITNPAAGTTPQRLSHREVLDAGRRAAPTMAALVRGIVRNLEESQGEGAHARAT